MKTYDGSVSDHFDGMRFYDPDGVPPKIARLVLRWQFGGDRKRAAWPEWRPSPHAIRRPRGSMATRCGCRMSGMQAG